MVHAIYLIIALISLSKPLAVASPTRAAQTRLDNRENNFSLNCVQVDERTELQELSNNCKLLKVFNQTEAELMWPNDSINLARFCACELSAMRSLWIDAFDYDTTRHLWHLVMNKNEFERKKAENSRLASNSSHFDFLWTDIDVTMYQISIYTSTKDFFKKQKENNPITRLRSDVKAELEKEEVWNMIRSVCRRVAKDPHHLYEYLENLSRLNPLIFLELVESTEYINMIYQASKTCKLLLNEHLNDYKLRPDSMDFVPVDGYQANYEELAAQADRRDNEIGYARDLDKTLEESSSMMISKCATTERPKEYSIHMLTLECPMMVQENVSADWFLQFESPFERSQLTINCGCQLLVHNKTWSILIEDPNVKVMSQALTSYMNQNRVPDFANTPIWNIFAWFNDIMNKFSSDRKLSIKQVRMVLDGHQDSLKPMRHADYERALELLRRGCNLIKFNYNRDPKLQSELKLIKYLDRLQLLSKDPMFIFHLTLLDTNLFKLHALSKMCDPIIK